MTQRILNGFTFILILFFTLQTNSNTLDDGVAIGSNDSPVVVIEYMSLTCSHCAKFHNETFPFIHEKYIKASKVKFILRDFPLDGIAYRASIISHCIANKNEEKYFGFIKYLFEQQKTLITSKDPIEELQKISSIAGLNKEGFYSCLENKTIANEVLLSRKNGEEKYNINSTPTLIINGTQYPGGLDQEAFKKIVDKIINK
ncbi:MAG: Disulfide bond formation protein D [Alphaproteobacteria bacterium MarineAlpha2_Bin1]|nr:MAG: Disulfide bond formation protein D [Alphaproteobacteria bacterium MarineAlpha2_Bin1]|tara:strand:- start:705 stop:1307 length:603 start_codon:yes stop_codon:yes gene_type:complete